jgi:hypothetical protein
MQTITNERSSELNYEIEGLEKRGGGGVFVCYPQCCYLKSHVVHDLSISSQDVAFAKACIGFLGDIFTVA